MHTLKSTNQLGSQVHFCLLEECISLSQRAGACLKDFTGGGGKTSVKMVSFSITDQFLLMIGLVFILNVVKKL